MEHLIGVWSQNLPKEGGHVPTNSWPEACLLHERIVTIIPQQAVNPSKKQNQVWSGHFIIPLNVRLNLRQMKMPLMRLNAIISKKWAIFTNKQFPSLCGYNFVMQLLCVDLYPWFLSSRVENYQLWYQKYSFNFLLNVIGRMNHVQAETFMDRFSLGVAQTSWTKTKCLLDEQVEIITLKNTNMCNDGFPCPHHHPTKPEFPVYCPPWKKTELI